MTGVELLAVSTSASKFPSLTAWMFSAILVYLWRGAGPAVLSYSVSIRCCNRLLVSRLPGGSRERRQPSCCPGRFVDLGVLRRGSLPRKVLAHAIQLDALPNAFVDEVLKSLADSVHQSAAGVLRELETGTCAVFQVENFDAVIEAAGCPHNRDGTIFKTIHLIQPTRLVPRRHEEHVGASFHLVSEGIVVGDFDGGAVRVGACERAEHVFVATVAGTEHHQAHVLAHQFV